MQRVQKREVSMSGINSVKILGSKKAMITESNVKSQFSEGELFE